MKICWTFIVLCDMRIYIYLILSSPIIGGYSGKDIKKREAQLCRSLHFLRLVGNCPPCRNEQRRTSH